MCYFEKNLCLVSKILLLKYRGCILYGSSDSSKPVLTYSYGQYVVCIDFGISSKSCFQTEWHILTFEYN